MKTAIDRVARRKPFYKACLDALAALAFFATVLAFCWLCCVCSGSSRERNNAGIQESLHVRLTGTDGKDRPFRRDATYEARHGAAEPGKGEL